MIKIITAMIETKFDYFQLQVESMIWYAIKFCQTSLCETPKRLNTVICHSPLMDSCHHGESWSAYQSRCQSVHRNCAIHQNGLLHQAHTIPNNGLQCSLRAIWNNLLLYTFPWCFRTPKSNGFTASVAVHRPLQNLADVIQIRNKGWCIAIFLR